MVLGVKQRPWAGEIMMHDEAALRAAKRRTQSEKVQGRLGSSAACQETRQPAWEPTREEARRLQGGSQTLVEPASLADFNFDSLCSLSSLSSQELAEFSEVLGTPVVERSPSGRVLSVGPSWPNLELGVDSTTQ